MLIKSGDSPSSAVGHSLVQVHYSGVNYKDALGVTGTAAIFKKDPIVPGIDLAGVALMGPLKGQKVLVQGGGIGEVYDGGYAQEVWVRDNLVLPLPKGLSLKESMALGTAGFTAALAIERMLQNGQTIEKGPVLVSGATGGVGQFSIQILHKLGYEVHALTHRPEHTELLIHLGANKVIDYKSFQKQGLRPLEKALYGGAIDNLGGDFLEQVLPKIHLWGNVASIGLAKGAGFSTSVMPFILRGISLLGASSNNCPTDMRQKIWKKLGSSWKPPHILEQINSVLFLQDILEYSKKLLSHNSKVGRALVDVKNS